MHIFLALDLTFSVIAFFLYAWDKRAAKASRRRVSERTLHMIALFGDWPGALLARRLLRHKTAKRTFQFAFWWTVVLNVAGTVLVSVWRARL